MPSPSVFIIILQYNNSQETLRCLESVKELDYPNYQVVVVDNASDKSEVNNIKECARSQPTTGLPCLQGSPVVFLENKKNLGYAGGNNAGINYALENGADYVFILNNDTTVEQDTLKKLVATTEADLKIGMVGPATKEGDKVAYFGKIAWLKTELTHSYMSPDEIHGRPVNRAPMYLTPKEYIIGAAMLIKKEVLKKIEGFDEIYFLYFEDADLNIRVQLAGYELKIVPEAVVHHQVSASTKKLGSPLILRYHMRNALIFNSLNAPWHIKIILIFWAGYVVLKNLIKMFIWPAKEVVADAIIEGVMDFYKNRFGAIIQNNLITIKN